MHYPDLPVELVHACLLEGRVNVAPQEIVLARRDGRWLAEWNSHELAWFAANEEGAARLGVERRVLALLKTRIAFAVPEITYVSADGAFDIRTRLEGVVVPDRAHEHLRNNPEAARQFGNWIGTALAQLHSVVNPDAVPAWLPRAVSWPEPTSWILERLPEVIGNNPLVAQITALLVSYENLRITHEDVVLAHTDLGLHNIVLVADSLEPRGLIDFEAAAYVDRHYDFRYLIMDFADTTLLSSACDAYRAATGITPQLSRILLYNAVSACCYLAYRAGIPPETRWCGRTLAEDLAWTGIALERYRAYSSK